MRWSADQYLKFEADRAQPIRDLLSRIDAAPRKIIDLGCGPGNSTELLEAHFPAAEISGIDSSEDMVAAARSRLPHIGFTRTDIVEWRDNTSYDLIFANAVLHWLPDHAALLPRLLARLNPGGVLAIQSPDNLEEPVHSALREAASDPRWAAVLGDVVKSRAQPQPGWYHALLVGQVTRLDIWRTTYFNHLAGGIDDVVDWFGGAGLRPYVEPLAREDRSAFVARYRALLEDAYPRLEDGSVLLPYPRLFLVARR